MKNQIIKLAGVAIACAVVSACDADFDNPVSGNAGNSGDADLSKFVTIGDSLTAGYADDALYLAGQENSYPAILAQQFAKVGGDANFTQPLVSDNLGGMLINGDPQYIDNRLVLDLTDPTAPSPVNVDGTPTTEVVGSGLNGTAFSNMGVPGAKSFHLGVAGYGNPLGLPDAANPYFTRFASDPATASMIGDATAQAPSFYVMWIGNNDVLLYATSGGDDSDPITDPAVFTGVYNQLVAGFKIANSAVQGVLVNIPDIKTIPYFTTVPYNAVPLDQDTADYLNSLYAEYNAGVALALADNLAEVVKRTISFSEGQNAVVIEDEYLTDLTKAGLPSIRQATVVDLLVLTASKDIGTESIPGDPGSVWGVGVPLADGHVLIPEETALIDAATTAFNATIEAIANDPLNPNLILVDSSAIMQEISDTGIDYGTGAIHAEYATGGAFSLDGVHPTARGYAVVANRIIDAINIGFNASIPRVNPGDYTTIFVQ